MLADAGHSGCAETVLVEHGFSADLLTGLARTGLATATTDTVRMGGRSVEVPWMRITNAGRFALAQQ